MNLSSFFGFHLVFSSEGKAVMMGRNFAIEVVKKFKK